MGVTNATMLKVLIVDNHELVRSFLTIDLQRYADIQVVGTAIDGQDAIAQTRQLRPDVILMDLQMPVMDGLTASRQIKAEFPNIKIIAYTSLDDPQTEVMSRSVAIDDFCYKDTETDTLVEMMRRA